MNVENDFEKCINEIVSTYRSVPNPFSFLPYKISTPRFFVAKNSPKGKLEELFRAADTDDNGTLSATEFVEAMSLPSVQHYMQVLEVKIQDCRPLFDILDDGDGRITIPEFCKGLMQLKGQARALDIVMLQRENKKVLLECQDWIATSTTPYGCFRK